MAGPDLGSHEANERRLFERWKQYLDEERCRFASPRLRLRQLISEFRAGELDAEAFCSKFEHTYNIELDKETLTPPEKEAFSVLFELVVWYSPFPEERAQIPNYLSEGDFLRAVEEAAHGLDMEPGD